jgi:predicted amidophosphoribosyltransferase
VPPYAAGPYATPLKPLIIGHKERRQLALAAPLGRVLAAVVTDLLVALSHDGPVVLVPVPSRAATVRSRGHDPTLRMTRAAATALRTAGRSARVVPAVGYVGRGADQAGLTQTDRLTNAQGRFRVGPAGVAAIRRDDGAVLVLVDDVITTGNTLRELQECLSRADIEVAGAAVVAATQRRVNFEAHVPYRILGPGATV